MPMMGPTPPISFDTPWNRIRTASRTRKTSLPRSSIGLLRSFVVSIDHSLRVEVGEPLLEIVDHVRARRMAAGVFMIRQAQVERAQHLARAGWPGRTWVPP